MGVLRPSTELASRIQTLRAFREEFRAALATATRYDTSLGGSYYGAPEGQEAAFDARLTRLAEFAGRARRAAGSDNISIVQFGITTEPILQWRDVFSFEEAHSAADVLDALNTTIGILEDRLAEARSTEKTIAFKLGWLASFPSRARAAAGPSRGAQRTAFWAAVAVEVVAGLILLALPLLAARVL